MQKICICILILVNLLAIQAGDAFGKPSPAISGLLSIAPGLGQVANGNSLEGLGWFVTSVGLFFSGNRYAGQVGYDLWMYNMYDAYRDAGASDTSKQNVFQNWIAPFNPLNLIDPIGPPMIALTVFASDPKNSLRGPKNRFFTLPFFTAVAAGEEALFRGFLYPAFSHLTHSKIIGATISSAAFSAFHLLNFTPFDSTGGALWMRFAMGMIFCLQLSYNKYDMRKGIFAHAWVDTIVDWRGGAKGIASITPPTPASTSTWKKYGLFPLSPKLNVQFQF